MISLQTLTNNRLALHPPMKQLPGCGIITSRPLLVMRWHGNPYHIPVIDLVSSYSLGLA